jgi:hypothetical protein
MRSVAFWRYINSKNTAALDAPEIFIDCVAAATAKINRGTTSRFIFIS